MKTITWLFIILVVIALGYKIFGSDDLPIEPVDQGEVVVGNILVDQVDILILESFPLQAQAVIKGNFGDACTEKDKITVNRRDNDYVIDISAKRPKTAICAQVLTPFEETVPLDILGLKKGTYVVIGNGVKKQFTLDADNVLPEGF
jgi:inhibitor of cysteine peptidase